MNPSLKIKDERGFAIVAAALLVAISIFFGLAAAVVVEHSHMVEGAAHAQQMEWARTREDIKLTMQGSNMEIINRGAQPSVIISLLCVDNNGSMTAQQENPPILLYAFGKENIFLGALAGNKIGVLTQLGNVFWRG